jgi:hypothetical protein
MVGSDRYGFYVGFNTPQTNILADLKPPQGSPAQAGSWVLNPLANKQVGHKVVFGIPAF